VAKTQAELIRESVSSLATPEAEAIEKFLGEVVTTTPEFQTAFQAAVASMAGTPAPEPVGAPKAPEPVQAGRVDAVILQEAIVAPPVPTVSEGELNNLRFRASKGDARSAAKLDRLQAQLHA